jgi:hypothetical protein
MLFDGIDQLNSPTSAFLRRFDTGTQGEKKPFSPAVFGQKAPPGLLIG